MVVVKLSGGLGNQMFQYAAGRRLALRHRTRLVVDTSHYKNYKDRGFELDCFKLAGDVLVDALPDQPLKPTVQNGFEDDDFVGLVGPGDGKVGRFEPRILSAPDNTRLIGLWQSEEYFKDYSGQIRQDFSFKKPATGQNAKLLTEIADHNAVSIHVRRGDYASYPHSVTLGPLGADYYQKALKIIKSKVKRPVFYVFSDDPVWCKHNLDLGHNFVVVDHNSKGCDDMRLMSACKHHIIANSSFSWWGAWLNPDPGKIVVAPEPWFIDAGFDTSDFVPRRWLQVKRQILVSAIMPVYNGDKFLRPAIKSILDQTYKDLELIIVDDASTDKTPSIIKSFQDPRIKIITHKKNRGVSASRNEAIAAAVGKYIALQDADDISKPDRFKAQVDYLEKRLSVGALGTNYDVIDDSGQNVVATTDVLTHPEDIKLAEIFSNQFGQGAMMLRRRLLNNSYDESKRYAEDYDLWTRLSHITELANLPAVLYKWRLHAASASAGDYMREHSYQIRDREFAYFNEHKGEYRFFSFHPFSIRGGFLAYLSKKSSLYRDMALMYGYHGLRRKALPITLLALAHAPWQARNYRQLFIITLRKNRLASLEYEII